MIFIGTLEKSFNCVAGQCPSRQESLAVINHDDVLSHENRLYVGGLQAE